MTQNSPHALNASRRVAPRPASLRAPARLLATSPILHHRGRIHPRRIKVTHQARHRRLQLFVLGEPRERLLSGSLLSTLKRPESGFLLRRNGKRNWLFILLSQNFGRKFFLISFRRIQRTYRIKLTRPRFRQRSVRSAVLKLAPLEALQLHVKRCATNLRPSARNIPTRNRPSIETRNSRCHKPQHEHKSTKRKH